MAEAKQQDLRQLTKMEKAAVVLLCMDEKSTGELFNKLEDEEIRKIATALLRLDQIPTAQIQNVMTEFGKGFTAPAPKPKDENGLSIDGSKATENLLSRSLSRGRSQQILSSLKDDAPTPTTSGKEGKFQEFINEMQPELISELLGKEHPQVLSIALSSVGRSTAKAVLAGLAEEIQIDVISRMARLDKVSGKTLEELRVYITQKINEKKKAPVQAVKTQTVTDLTIEGMEGTLKILKGLKRDQSMKIIAEIEKFDQELGAEISKRMFTMEDLERANDMGIRELLRGVTTEDLKVALKDTPDTLKEKFFKNMSERAAMIMREDMSVMPPKKVEEIEAAQANILKVAKEMIKEEKIILEEVVDEE